MRNVIKSILEMMKRILFVIFYVLDGITFSDCVPNIRKSSSISVSDIRAYREELEKQHYIGYVANEDMYRNWPEVHKNPIYDCQRFLEIIFPKKKDLAFVTPRIQKVILNYKQIKDGHNNVLKPIRVTALECKLKTPRWRRKLIHFIRSPQSPECAFFLNRTGKRSSNFYIVECICEHMVYHHFRKQLGLLEENIPQEINRIERHQLLILSDEEIKIKYAEYEQKHYDYCRFNPDMCKMWPEVQTISQNECQRFLRRMLFRNHNLSSVIARVHPVSLHFKEIRVENKGMPDPVEVNAIECKLPHAVKNRRYINFIRSPSYPICVFCIIYMMLLTGEHYFIAEEICDTPNHGTSLHNILREYDKSFKSSKMKEMSEFETAKKRQEHESIHFQSYSINQTNYEKWPELEEINMESRCRELVQNVCPGISGTREIINLIARSGSIQLKYAINDTIPSGAVKSLECHVPERPPPNRFHFIRTPKPNCIYWIIRRKSRNNSYFIAREFCKDDTELIGSYEIDVGDDANDADDLWKV